MGFSRGKDRQKKTQSFPAAAPRQQNPLLFPRMFQSRHFFAFCAQNRRGEQLMWCKGNLWGFFLGFFIQNSSWKVLVSDLPTLWDGHRLLLQYFLMFQCTDLLKKCVRTFICRKKKNAAITKLQQENTCGLSSNIWNSFIWVLDILFTCSASSQNISCWNYRISVQIYFIFFFLDMGSVPPWGNSNFLLCTETLLCWSFVVRSSLLVLWSSHRVFELLLSGGEKRKEKWIWGLCCDCPAAGISAVGQT